MPKPTTFDHEKFLAELQARAKHYNDMGNEIKDENPHSYGFYTAIYIALQETTVAFNKAITTNERN
jgi:hypothetical protein